MSVVLAQSSSQPVSSTQSLQVTRLEPTIGAEISGIDLSQPITSALRDELRALLLEHKVIFFRDQHIDTAQQIAFAQQFGELYVHPTTQQNDTSKPHAHLIQAQDDRKLYGPRTSGRWHTDTSWLLQPTLGAVLRAVDLPEIGGDTLWADTAAVYQGCRKNCAKKSTRCSWCMTSRKPWIKWDSITRSLLTHWSAPIRKPA